MNAMKVLAVVLVLLGLGGCGGHKPPNTQPTAVQVQVGSPVPK